MKKRIRIIGVPVDLGAGRRGVDMGPSALRVAGIDSRVAALGHDVDDLGDLTVTVPETVSFGRPDLRFVEGILSINQSLAELVRQILAAGGFPLVLGGDHSIAIGSVAGCAAHFSRPIDDAAQSAPVRTPPELPSTPGREQAAAHRAPRLGVVWLDAHADMNTPATTPSGNIHGMCLAALLGQGDERLVGVGGAGPKLAGKNVALVAARDIDPGEREHLRQTGVHVFTMRQIDERGMAAVMSDAIRAASDGTAGIHLQLDMDALDPEFAPGTGTPVPGGLSYREAHLAMEMLADAGNLVAIDVVEINPIMGFQNQTAELAVELVLSALGKRIL